MYTNLKVNDFGGFASVFYWSSSVDSSYKAWSQAFVGGYQGSRDKDYTYYVRAVRAF